MAEIVSIAETIAADSPRRAITFAAELRAQCLSLADLHAAFPLVSRYESLGIRRRVHGNYLIFYKVEPDRVVILHILHGARDYLDILEAGSKPM
ncbi:type II toxin-antitoxin system RelE/ParE family toxin [Variibacter gotjawalensis]|nr:plasmid stabilization system protein ParE [Variibacter gotjawalensis]